MTLVHALPGVLLLGLLPQGEAAAQASAQVTVSAQVVAPITVTILRHLVWQDFPRSPGGGAGNPGGPGGKGRVIQPTFPNAGEWRAVGSSGAQVSITFTLPAVLTHSTMPGVSVPISFNDGSAIWRPQIDDPTGRGAQRFDPRMGTTAQFAVDSNPVLYIWIGCLVSPSPKQPSGVYTASFLVSVAYL